MKKVTGEEVKKAMIDNDITYVEHHDCGFCKQYVYYSRVDEDLYFNPDCGCTSYDALPEVSSWEDAADWINMQSKDKNRIEIAKRFGLELTSLNPLDMLAEGSCAAK